MTPRVLLHKGRSEYLSLNTMVDGLAAGFGRQGFSPAVLDVGAPDYGERVGPLLREGGIALIASLNGIGLPREAGTFQDAIGAPTFVAYLDHPYYHLDRLAVPLPRLHLGFPSPAHVAFCREDFRPPLSVCHLPHAAEPRSGRPWRERDIPLLYSGAPLAGDPEALRAAWRNHGARAERALNDILDAHRAEPRRPLERVAGAVLGRRPDQYAAILPFFLAADEYLRSRIKVAALETLAAAGIRTTVCGPGWEAFAGRHDLRGSLPAPATFALMDRAKLVLNLLPPYYESHERVFQAMAAGAVAATTPAGLWENLFPPDAFLELPYEPKALAFALAAALADDGGLEAMAARGRTIFAAGHAWDHRAVAILDFLRRAGEPLP